MRPSRIGMLLLALAPLAGCTPKVELATDKPIELNLNIRVEQEVRIKLDREVEELIRAERNPDEVRSRGGDLPLADAEDSREVKDAKRAGLVGERYDGYLGIVETSAGPEIQTLVERVNAGRGEVYRRLAEEYAASVRDVEAVAGVRRIERSQPGEFVLRPDERWRATSG